MEHDQKWIVVKVDGKIAAISTGYAALAAIATRLAQQKTISYNNICAETVGFEQVWKLRQTLGWDDLMLSGTEFQKKVWRKLFDLTHDKDGQLLPPKMICYSDFAELCQNKNNCALQNIHSNAKKCAGDFLTPKSFSIRKGHYQNPTNLVRRYLIAAAAI